MKGRVLIVAGSDSGGGAGIQADIKTVTCLGGYAMTAVTALTAQNTRGVYGIHAVPPAFIQQQMRVVIEDIGVDCIKTGMLHDDPTIDAVVEVLHENPDVPVVVDPVMVAQSGASLLDRDSVQTLKRHLLPLARVITPNVPEAERLSGMEIRDENDMEHAARTLLTMGVPAVLLKGGHLEADQVTDVLGVQGGIHEFQSPRVRGRNGHGTGCTLASAMATGLAQGLDLIDAVNRGREYLQLALRDAPGYGQGDGPLNHAVTVASFKAEF